LCAKAVKTFKPTRHNRLSHRLTTWAAKVLGALINQQLKAAVPWHI